jgi:EAL domain-containing protein (putative c-di-GMP-specific phosphodiesterase class I)
VNALLHLAHALQLHVVAEGIDSREKLNYLIEHQCDEAQGYYIARPLSADDFYHFVMSWRSSHPIFCE